MTPAHASHFDAREPLHLLRADGATAHVQSGTKTFAIDLRTGTATPGPDARPREDAPEIDHVALARANWLRAQQLGLGPDVMPIEVPLEIAGAVITMREDYSTDEGLAVTITSPARSRVSLPGEVQDVATADGALVGVRTTRGVFVVDVDHSALAAVAYEPDDTVVLASRDDLIAVATGGVLHLVQRDGAWLRTWAPDHTESVAITDRYVVLVAGLDSYAIDRRVFTECAGSFVSRRPLDVSLSIAPRADARNDDMVCVVRTVLQRFIALTEVRTQRHFNFTLQDPRLAQGLAKGDRVFVIDGALVKESALPSNYGTPAPELHDAASLPPHESVAPLPKREPLAFDGPTGLEPLAREIGFVASPLLLRFLERHDNGWKWPFGEFAPDTRTPDFGIPVDPCIVPLFDLQSGDYFCLYDYPPARAEGHPLVRYNHEEDSLEWCGANFDEALANVLRAELKYSAPAALAVLRGLALPITYLDEHGGGAVPSWFETPHPQGPWQYRPKRHSDRWLDDGDKLRSAGDAIGAERAYVRALHETLEPAHRDAIRAKLTEVYAALGWSFQALRM